MKKSILIGMIFLFVISVNAYTPPNYDNINLVFDETVAYTSPSYDNINLVFDLGGITSSCVYSGSGEWVIQMTENCTLSTQTVNNFIVVNGSDGYLIVNGTVLAKNLSLVPSSYNKTFKIWVTNGSTFGIYK
jgi:hypothetical protein